MGTRIFGNGLAANENRRKKETERSTVRAAGNAIKRDQLVLVRINLSRTAGDSGTELFGNGVN